MAILKDFSVLTLIVVWTAGVSWWYVQKSLQVNQVINEVNNQVKLNSAAAATLKTESVSKEYIEIVVKWMTQDVQKAQAIAQVAQVQVAQVQGATTALAPMLANPELQKTLTTLASSPAAVSAMSELATTVKEAEASGDDNKTLELVSRLDKSDETIKTIEDSLKKIEALDVPSLIVKLENLKAGTPSLEALDSAIKKTTDELTRRGDEAIQKEVNQLSSKLSDQIINSTQPVNVRIGNAENSILTLNTKVETNTLDISTLKSNNITNTANILTLQAWALSALDSISGIHNDLGWLTINLQDISKQVVPIGGTLCIADWLGVSVESNFARADGQTLSEPLSPLNGKTLPNLNIAQLYLRWWSTGWILLEPSIPLLWTVLTDVTFGTVNLSDGAFGTNYHVYRSDSNVKIPIQLWDATELRVKSLSCVFYIRIK